MHASWLNQCEIYFSVVEHKVGSPNDFHDLADLENRLIAFQELYSAAARPFKWKYTTDDLNALLARLATMNAVHRSSPRDTRRTYGEDHLQ